MTLTDKETRVAGLLAEGLSNRDIADLTGQCLRTVELHRHNLRKKLGASTAFQSGVKWTLEAMAAAKREVSHESI